MSLAGLSYKQLQALAKKNGISARQKASELVSALQQLDGFAEETKREQEEEATADTDAAEPTAEAPAPKAKGKRGRGGRKAAAAAADRDEEDAQEEQQQQQQTTSAAESEAVSMEDVEEEEEEPAPVRFRAAAARKKSKMAHAAPMETDAAAAAEEEEGPGGEESSVAPRDRITKRGRRPKRVTVSEVDTVPVVARDSLVAQVQPAATAAALAPAPAAAAGGSRRNSANSDKGASPQRAAPPQPPSPPARPAAAAPRPSMGMSARKRWSHATVELFGTVLAPPASVLAGAPVVAAPAPTSRPSSKWQAPPPLPQVPEPAHRRSRSRFEFGSGGSGTHGPTSLAPENLKEQYAAQHARAHNASPSRGGLLMAAAARAQASPPASGSTAYRSAYSPSPSRRSAAAATAAASVLTQLPTPSSAGIPPLPSPPAPLSSARANGPAEVASRLSFSQFSPEKVAAAAAESVARHADSPIKKLPQTLFTSAAYHAPPPASSPTASGSFTAGSHTIRKAGAAAPTKGLSATAGANTLFSRDARSGRTTGAGAAAAPKGSPSASSGVLGRKSFASTAGPLSLASMTTTVAAAAPERPKFDLQASLQRPVGWKLKTGSLRQGQAAAAAPAPAAAPAAQPAASASISSNPARTTQLKAREFVSTKPAQRAVQEKKQLVARQTRMQQARLKK